MTTITPAPPISAPPAARAPVYPLLWLRGVAAIAVVTFHAYQWNRVSPSWAWPWSGTPHQLMMGTDAFVDMFFVLSGLVLWLPVARAALDGAAAPSGRAVLVRRLARLLPLYLVVVLLVWGVTNPVLPGHWQDLVMHLTFTHVYSDEVIFWTDGPAWSLAVEFHFYLLVALAIPVLGRVVRRLGRGGRLVSVCLLPAALLVTTACYLTWAELTDQSRTHWSVWFSPLSRAADFGIGMLLAVAVAGGLRLGARVRAPLALLGVAALVGLVVVRPADTNLGELWHPAYAAVVALGLSAIVLSDGPWPRVLSWAPAAWIGSLGYGIYLIHEPVMRYLNHLGLLPARQSGWFFLVTALIVTVPSVILAWVSSRTVEAAGLRLAGSLRRDGTERDYYPHLSS